MRGRYAIVAAIVLSLLGAPAAAPAKELSKVAVCGQDRECVRYDTSDFRSLTFLADDGGPTDPPSAAAPWYRVRFTADTREHGGGLERWSVAYVPSAGSLRVGDQGGDFAWVALNPRAAAVLERAARDLPAFPAARLRGLQPAPPQDHVSEVVTLAPRDAAKGDGSESAAMPWRWIGGGVVAAALVLLAIAGKRHPRRRGEETPPRTGSAAAGG